MVVTLKNQQRNNQYQGNNQNRSGNWVRNNNQNPRNNQRPQRRPNGLHPVRLNSQIYASFSIVVLALIVTNCK